MKPNRAINLAVVLILLLWFGFGTAIALAVDYLWFDALEHGTLFMTSLKAQVGIWLAVFALAVVAIGLNARAAWKDAPINFGVLGSGGETELRISSWQIERMARQAVVVLVGLLSLGFANGVSRAWMEVLAYLNREPFGVTDPVFGRDIGFYFFELPVYELVHQLLIGLCFVSLAFVAGVHFLREQLRVPRVAEGIPDAKVLTIGPGVDVLRQLEQGPQKRGLSDSGRAHLLNLGAVFFLLLGVGFWLRRFDLLFERTGAVFGVGYTDINAHIPVLWVMCGVAAVAAVSLIASVFRGGWRVPAFTVGGFFAASAILNGIYPPLVQKFFVTPNELQVESEYLEHNIQATREAYGFADIEVKPFEAATDLTMEDIDSNPLTIKNVRLWDTTPLLTTYSQLQEIRLYYDFVSVDVDRYEINGELRQVMLSGREMNVHNLSSQAQTFVNQRLQYTHGYGLTMSPVNVVTEEGLPELFIKDIPPQTVSPELEITRPEIYYGELTDEFVLVRTNGEEFDYPLGDQNQYTRYEGAGGVDIGSLGRRLLFSYYFKSADVLLSNYLTEESRVLFRRQIVERVTRLAPFLHFDSDPYLVINEGRLFWILDAYTVSSRYPYSERHRGSFGSRANYVRNSVKVVMDTYNGDVSFYISDSEDPMVRVYDRVFPGTFKALEEMPEGLRSHLRHPADLFRLQADMYRTYHMTDPNVFYNKEDMWEFPTELYSGSARIMEPYYLIMKLPDEERAEFIQLLPFVPTNRENMISWMAARSDPPHNGELLLYQFPKQKLIFGPRQIESRIDQDPEISEQITLWSQSGSRVVRGNLLVIPIRDSRMYVEPLYLQAESSQLPELKRVLVSYEKRIAMRETLDEALLAVFDLEDVAERLPTGREQRQEERAAREAREDVGEGSGVSRDREIPVEWQVLVNDAVRQLDAAEAAQRSGDWALYGEELSKLRDTVRELEAAGVIEPRPENTENTENTEDGE